MSEVQETSLPGIGVRYDVTTEAGERVGVLVHRTGRRDLLVYDRDDPDRCRATMALAPDEARTVAELLGPSQLVTQLGATQQELGGLVIDWLTVRPGSELAGATLRSAAVHTRTGVSVVAFLRGTTTLASPGADVAMEADDVLVAVGTPDGVHQLAALARSR